MSKIPGLQDSVQLVADLVEAGKNAVSAQGILNKLKSFSKVGQDAIKLVPEIVGIPGEIKAMAAEDYQALVETIVEDFAVKDPAKKEIIHSSLKAVGNFVTVTLPDVLAIVAAVKGISMIAESMQEKPSVDQPTPASAK